MNSPLPTQLVTKTPLGSTSTHSRGGSAALGFGSVSAPSLTRRVVPGEVEGANTNSPGVAHLQPLLAAIVRSKVYREFDQAFAEATGIPVCLRSPDSWNLPHHGHRMENPFCRLLAERGPSCASCLRTMQQLSDGIQEEPRTIQCPAGLIETVVPVRVNGVLIGLLQIGQTACRKPTTVQIQRITGLAEKWGVPVTTEDLRTVYCGTRVVNSSQHEAYVVMLRTFAEFLSILGRQIFVRLANAEPTLVTRAKEFIQKNQTEALSLAKVAAAVHTSSFHFCKVFHKATGLTFTRYVSQLRVEKAKNLLLNPNCSISEIAFQVGFQSLTHFNRTFRQLIGRSPTDYRRRLPATSGKI